MMPRPLSATRGVIACFPARGECGQTKTSPNGSIFELEFYGVNCLF